MDYLVVDALPAVCDSWRNRYDSLTLFTPRSMSSLPGKPLSGSADGYATKDEFANYLGRYADGHRVVNGTRIASLWKDDETFEATAEDGRRFSSRAVVVATGAFQTPRIPTLSASFSPGSSFPSGFSAAAHGGGFSVSGSSAPVRTVLSAGGCGRSIRSLIAETMTARPQAKAPGGGRVARHIRRRYPRGSKDRRLGDRVRGRFLVDGYRRCRPGRRPDPARRRSVSGTPPVLRRQALAAEPGLRSYPQSRRGRPLHRREDWHAATALTPHRARRPSSRRRTCLPASRSRSSNARRRGVP